MEITLLIFIKYIDILLKNIKKKQYVCHNKSMKEPTETEHKRKHKVYQEISNYQQVLMKWPDHSQY